MAKPTKKKVTAAVGAREKRIVKIRKPHGPIKRSAIDFGVSNQLSQSAAPEPLSLPAALERQASPEVLNRLWTIIESRKSADPAVSHSARLLAKGKPRIAQKLGEEAIECLIEIMAGNRRER
jgi:phosphoribosyl-ATP pyrophosphohydrolase